MRISDWSSDVCSSDLVWFNRVHSFATSWAFEMETIILGWYVLVETGSVLLLTVFASLQYIGTLITPMFGVIGDRIGSRNLLCAMRAARSAGRRVGKECVSPISFRMSPYH